LYASKDLDIKARRDGSQYQWQEYISGRWQNIAGAITDSITVQNFNGRFFRCQIIKSATQILYTTTYTGKTDSTTALITYNVGDYVAPIPTVEEWDYNTILNAQFNGNLASRNVDFALYQIQALRIKRRETDGGENKWITLYEQSVYSEQDLKITYIDTTARSNTKFTYALVPVWSENAGEHRAGAEGNYNTVDVTSKFNGVWFVRRSVRYNAVMEVKLSTQLNQITSTIVTLANKYPYVNRYGNSQYESGSFDCVIVHFNGEDCQFDLDGGVNYRRQVDEFLLDGAVKIIKFEDGQIWLASIVENIPKDFSDWYKLPSYNISFVQVGKYDSSTDLYNAGLIDVNIESDSYLEENGGY